MYHSSNVSLLAARQQESSWLVSYMNIAGVGRKHSPIKETLTVSCVCLELFLIVSIEKIMNNYSSRIQIRLEAHKRHPTPHSNKWAMGCLLWRYWWNLTAPHCMSRVSCQKGPTRHAYPWQIGPFWWDTLDVDFCFWSISVTCKLVHIDDILYAS